MQDTPLLTDRAALERNRQRAMKSPVTFLQEIAAADLQDRLQMVNRSFTKPVIVSPFPEQWEDFLPGVPVISDDEVLNLKPDAHDLVIHALCLHWANDPVGQLIQCRQALQADGLFLGCLFGGQTLSELRASLAEAEAEVSGGLSSRVLPMAEIRDLGSLLQRAGFALPVADSFPLTTSYETPLHLMQELRSMGENSALHTRPRHFSRRSVLTRAVEIYHRQFPEENGRIRASFELIFLTGWAPDPSQQQPLRPGSAAARLADALNSKETPLKD